MPVRKLLGWGRGWLEKSKCVTVHRRQAETIQIFLSFIFMLLSLGKVFVFVFNENLTILFLRDRNRDEHRPVNTQTSREGGACHRGRAPQSYCL